MDMSMQKQEVSLSLPGALDLAVEASHPTESVLSTSAVSRGFHVARDWPCLWLSS